mmetsp:Transcript_4070/g.17057  ORF Transcript_4070/g.17057 Transcript_4070/m.17057 type:complete len:216 (-) Transcript_4070:164-811(-)
MALEACTSPRSTPSRGTTFLLRVEPLARARAAIVSSTRAATPSSSSSSSASPSSADATGLRLAVSADTLARPRSLNDAWAPSNRRRRSAIRAVADDMPAADVAVPPGVVEPDAKVSVALTFASAEMFDRSEGGRTPEGPTLPRRGAGGDLAEPDRETSTALGRAGGSARSCSSRRLGARAEPAPRDPVPASGGDVDADGGPNPADDSAAGARDMR